MMTSKMALLAGLVSFSLAGVAAAQNRNVQTVEVPAGSVVLVIPAGVARPALASAFAPVFAPNLEPIAMLRDMDAMMANVRQIMDSADTLPRGNGVAGVVVTSFSDGHGTCTRRVTYSGNSAPIVQVSGDACSGAATPAAIPAPQVQPPARTIPRTIEVQNRTAPIQVASAR